VAASSKPSCFGQLGFVVAEISRIDGNITTEALLANPSFNRVRKFLHDNLHSLHFSVAEFFEGSPKLINYILKHPHEFYELLADVSDVEDADDDSDSFETLEGSKSSDRNIIDESETDEERSLESHKRAVKPRLTFKVLPWAIDSALDTFNVDTAAMFLDGQQGVVRT